MRRAKSDGWWRRREESMAHARQRLRDEQEGWVGWMLRLGATTFAGYTFKDEDTSEAWARRCRDRWFDVMMDRLQRPIWGIGCTEYQKRGAVHFHVALRGLMPAQRVTVAEVLAVRTLAQRVWASITESSSRFDPWEQSRARYIAKYVTKGGRLEPVGAWPGDFGRAVEQRRLEFFTTRSATA